MTEEQRASYMGRHLAIDPSLEVATLLQLEPGILAETRYPLCANTGSTMIRALLVNYHAEQLRELFKKHNFDLPEAAKEPYRIMTGVQLLYRGKEQDQSYGRHMVLLKRAMGWSSGVVLQGPFAGTIVDFSLHLHVQNDALITSVWPDKPANSDALLYALKMYDTKEKASPAQFLSLNQEVKLFLDGFYRKWINEHPELVTEREHFFALCHELGIPVDTDRFHYTTVL